MNYPQREYGPQYDERNYGPETAAMDPYTLQITNRLGEAEKQVADLSARIYRLNDKLFGPSPVLGKAEPMFNNDKVPVPKAMMEQIVGQANVLCRRLADLSESVSRLETL